VTVVAPTGDASIVHVVVDGVTEAEALAFVSRMTRRSPLEAERAIAVGIVGPGC
jgi:hypothetical protein